MDKRIPNQIQKSVRGCLTKFKSSHKQIQFHRCMNARTTSFAVDRKGKTSDAVTLSDVDRFLFENFRSLYQKEHEEEVAKKNEAKKAAAYVVESPSFLDLPPPKNLRGSERFFVPSTSSRSLVVDEASSSSASVKNDFPEGSDKAGRGVSAPPDDFIAVLSYSPSPYNDFRLSMQEVVEARLEHDGEVDWGFLEGLLFYYLDINKKKWHRFILRAFVDLIVALREKYGRNPANRQPLNGGAERRKLKYKCDVVRA